ncbi:MAG: zf-HC2 domain-containing protein [Candidatus Aminicenantes bacterium]|nr:zf-HC2 domain-containing protein [Candidatus Aminicenantes bacterium]
MKCKHFENSIILFLYNELSEKEEKILNNHLTACEHCREFLEENKKMFSDISDSVPDEFDPAWDKYWTEINSEISNTGKEKFSLFPFNSKALSFAMSIIILVAGILIGRFFMSSPKGETLIKKKSSNLLYVKDYFEDVKPVMLDYANYTIPMNNGNGGPVDKKIIRTMLDETRLLKRHISPDKNPYLATLLEELELILTEIKNVTPGEKDSMRFLQGMIREKDIPLKIDLFKNKLKRSQRI